MKTIVDRYRKVLETGKPIENERLLAETALALYISDSHNSDIDNSLNIIFTKLVYPELLAHKLLSVRTDTMITNADKKELGVELPSEVVDALDASSIVHDKCQLFEMIKDISEVIISHLNTQLIHKMIKNSFRRKRFNTIDCLDLYEINIAANSLEADYIITNPNVVDTFINKYKDFNLQDNFSVNYGTSYVGTLQLSCGKLDVYENTFALNDFVLLGKQNGMIYRPHMVCNLEGNQLYNYSSIEENEIEDYYHYFKIL